MFQTDYAAMEIFQIKIDIADDMFSSRLPYWFST